MRGLPLYARATLFLTRSTSLLLSIRRLLLLKRAGLLSFPSCLLGLNVFVKFGYASYLVLMDSLLYVLTIKTEAVFSPQKSVATYQRARRYNSEGDNINF